MTTIADCLSTLGVSIEPLAACHGVQAEWAMIKKAYFKSALSNHPDKGGDAAKFRKVQAVFEALRALYDSDAVASFATSASKAVDAQARSDSSTPSWEFYADAAEEPVPIYRVERAKSGRSKCAAKGAAKTCAEGACIPKDALRVGWLNAETGSYGGWVRLECWRVPSKVWLGLPDPDSCADASLFMAALLSMGSVVLSGVGELSQEEAVAFTAHCMRKSAWAALVTRKSVPPPPPKATTASAPTDAAAASSALGVSSASTSSALVADKPSEKRFVVPTPGQDAPANSLAGKTVVLTGIFPEVGGGAGLDLGKARVKAMVEAFGGKVTSSVSGRTDLLIVGKEPGASKVGKAQSNGACTLMSLHDVRQGLLLGDLAAISNGKAPMVIQNFSAGYRGNGIGYAIKAAPPPPKAPPVPPAPKPAASTAKAPPPPKAKAPQAKAKAAPTAKAPMTKAPTAKASPGDVADAKDEGTLKKASAKPAPKVKAKDQEMIAKKRKAAAELWIAVEPIAAPKKLRGPPKDRSRS